MHILSLAKMEFPKHSKKTVRPKKMVKTVRKRGGTRTYLWKISGTRRIRPKIQSFIQQVNRRPSEVADFLVGDQNQKSFRIDSLNIRIGSIDICTLPIGYVQQHFHSNLKFRPPFFSVTKRPFLWSAERPYLHKLIIFILENRCVFVRKYQ